MWWRKFERHDMTVEDRNDDRECLAACRERIGRPGRSSAPPGYEYRFDPAQETGSASAAAAPSPARASPATVDGDRRGRGPDRAQGQPGQLLPQRSASSPTSTSARSRSRGRRAVRGGMGAGRGRVAGGGRPAAPPPAAHRGPTAVRWSAGGRPGRRTPATWSRRLDGSTLCIQGPPGTGKTYTAAAIIVDLLRRGARVGVTAQSHKVILKLMDAVVEAMAGKASRRRSTRFSGKDESRCPTAAHRSGQVGGRDGVLGDGAVLVGGTAWVFSRPEMAGRFDYLFVDEAGPGLARQRRRRRPVRPQPDPGRRPDAARPADAGQPPRRHRPLLPRVPARRPRHRPARPRRLPRPLAPDAPGRVPVRLRGDLRRPARAASPRPRGTGCSGARATRLVPQETGVVWVPVAHDGCTQSSDEECDAIVAIVEELLGRGWWTATAPSGR